MRVKRTNSKKKTIIMALALLVAGGVCVGLSYSQSWWPFDQKSQDNSSDTRDVNSVDYSPPTDEEIEQSQNGKKNSAGLDDEQNNTDNNSTELTEVSIGVAFADIVGRNVEIRAFTPSVIESDGECTANLTLGSLNVVEKTKAFIDSTSTQCESIRIPVNKFGGSGEWSLLVEYRSSTSSGKSEIISVKIP